MKTQLIALAALLSLATSGARANETKNVEVVNTDAHPVPVKQIGTSSVNIANTPSVTISGTPTVNLANGASVAISGQPTVQLAGTPTVALANGASVSLSGTPTVSIAAQQPFFLTTHISAPNGSGSGFGSINVPSGFRAVIEFVTIAGNMESAKSEAALNVTTDMGHGQGGYVAVPLSGSIFGATASMQTKLYADANTQIACVLYTNSQYNVDANCSVSGYLIPAP